MTLPDNWLDETLANLVWEFQLISNGIDLEQHTISEAGELERAELKATKQAILRNLEQEMLAVIGEDEIVPVYDGSDTDHESFFEEWKRNQLRAEQRTKLTALMEKLQ